MPSQPKPMTTENMLAMLQRFAAERKARDPRNFVFEFTPSVEPGRAIILDRVSFEDGRYRVILHDQYADTVTAALASLPA